jgi:hypothetical protein
MRSVSEKEKGTPVPSAPSHTFSHLVVVHVAVAFCQARHQAPAAVRGGEGLGGGAPGRGL